VATAARAGSNKKSVSPVLPPVTRNNQSEAVKKRVVYLPVLTVLVGRAACAAAAKFVEVFAFSLAWLVVLARALLSSLLTLLRITSGRLFTEIFLSRSSFIILSCAILFLLPCIRRYSV
jgi:hypothetical protein